MKIFLPTFFLTIFYSVAFAQPANDNIAAATTIIHSNNNCSANAAYTTVNATSDGLIGNCWENGPNYNVWFKFVATTTEVTLDLKTGGVEGTVQHASMALWESDASTEVACVRRINAYTDVQISNASLTIGNTYYVSVDNYVGLSYRGTFTLCIDDDITYDEVAGAEVLTDLNNWCSADAAYTTINASSDGSIGSCWENGPNYTRWFKFVAVSNNVTIQMKTGGAEGSIQHLNMALWQSDASTEVACVRRVNAYTDISVSSSALVNGNTYYISCDNYVGLGYRGTFTLCIDNVDTEYYSITDGNWDDGNTWSIVSHAGPAAASFPDAGDIAYIEDHDITVNSAEVCAEVGMTITSDATSLTMDGASLTVSGKFMMSVPGTNKDANIDLINGASLSINDDMTISKTGGNKEVILALETGCAVTVNKTMTWDVDGGVSKDAEINLDGTATLTVGEDLILDHSAGQPIKFTLNNTASLSVDRDIQFTAAGDGTTEIELNNTAALTIGRNFVRGTPAYGILDCNDDAVVTYSTTNYSQTFASNTGSGTGDAFTYQHVVINNQHITEPQLTANSTITIPQTLTLTDGVILTTSTNLLTIEDNATVSGASSASYIDGPMKKVGDEAFVFPVGNGSFYSPIAISAPTNATTEFTAEYNANAYTDVTTITGTLSRVSGGEYWDLSRGIGTSPGDDVYVTLHWENGARSGITDLDSLTVSHWDGAIWEDFSQSAYTGNTTKGTITSLNKVGNFSPFAFGAISVNPGINPLPVELVTFNAILNEDRIELTWITASEINNDYFEIEKSTDAKTFNYVSTVYGNGNSNQMIEYFDVDYDLKEGTTYYRLKQVDFDGTTSYSNIVPVKYDPESIQQSINLLPNPVLASGTLHIELEGFKNNNVLLVLRDITGKEFYAKAKLIETNYQLEAIVLDSSMPRGSYLIIASSEKKIVSKKLIIQ